MFKTLNGRPTDEVSVERTVDVRFVGTLPFRFRFVSVPCLLSLGHILTDISNGCRKDNFFQSVHVRKTSVLIRSTSVHIRFMSV